MDGGCVDVDEAGVFTVCLIASCFDEQDTVATSSWYGSKSITAWARAHDNLFNEYVNRTQAVWRQVPR